MKRAMSDGGGRGWGRTQGRFLRWLLMMTMTLTLMVLAGPGAGLARVYGQAEEAVGQGTAGESSAEESAGQAEPLDAARKKADELLDTTREKVEEISQQVDRSPQAREASQGILKPIYQLAQRLAFPHFYWVAFALMVAGVASFGLQLVLGKLVVLMKMGFSLTAILSDVLGLAISLFGLVLTTQAAAEHPVNDATFTESPWMVLSATGVGIIVGFLAYLWGQSEELQAVEGRRREG